MKEVSVLASASVVLDSFMPGSREVSPILSVLCIAGNHL